MSKYVTEFAPTLFFLSLPLSWSSKQGGNEIATTVIKNNNNNNKNNNQISLRTLLGMGMCERKVVGARLPLDLNCRYMLQALA